MFALQLMWVPVNICLQFDDMDNKHTNTKKCMQCILVHGYSLYWYVFTLVSSDNLMFRIQYSLFYLIIHAAVCSHFTIFMVQKKLPTFHHTLYSCCHSNHTICTKCFVHSYFWFVEISDK